MQLSKVVRVAHLTLYPNQACLPLEEWTNFLNKEFLEATRVVEVCVAILLFYLVFIYYFSNLNMIDYFKSTNKPSWVTMLALLSC